MKKMLKTLGTAFLVFGMLLFVAGMFFRLHEWPDMFYGVYTGPALMITGLLLLVVRLLVIKKKK